MNDRRNPNPKVLEPAARDTMALETDLLSDLIDQKHACLRTLRDMGTRQIELVDAGAMSELLDVLAAKQRVLGRLQKIERQLDPFRNQDAGRRQWRSEDDRRQCARRIDECESLLAEIAGQEQRSRRELVRRRDETAAQLEGVNQAVRARGAYATASPGGVGRLDLSSEG